MHNIELIYDGDCPNRDKARSQLRLALDELGLPAQWKEWERSNPEAPAHVRNYGSPTILVDGKDVAGAKPSDGASSCRLYEGRNGGFEGIPPLEAIVSALKE